MKSDASRAVGTAWAAYVLGYDVRHFWLWHQSVWACRHMAIMERVQFDPSVLASAVDMDRAADVASDGLVPSATVRRLTKWTTEWLASAKQLLHDLDPRRAYDSDIDWDQESPPGLDLLSATSKELEDGLTASPHLKRWHAFGQALAIAAYGMWETSVTDAKDLRDQLSLLCHEGGYDFLPLVITFFDRIVAGRKLMREMQVFVDPVLRVPRLQKVDVHVRRALAGGSAPRAAVAVDGGGVTFFGTRINRDKFHPAEWGMLVCLCRQPNRMVPPEALARSGGLMARKPNVAPHISRIRNVLRSAMTPDLGPVRLTPEARQAFIRAHEFPEMPPKYSLEIDRILIRVDEKA